MKFPSEVPFIPFSSSFLQSSFPSFLPRTNGNFLSVKIREEAEGDGLEEEVEGGGPKREEQLSLYFPLRIGGGKRVFLLRSVGIIHCLRESDDDDENPIILLAQRLYK